jgi:ABC-type phosphate transport system substrate-binding protein
VVGAVAVAGITGAISSQTSSQAGTSGANGQAQTTIILGGSTTMTNATQALATEYHSLHPSVAFVIEQGGSGAAEQAMGQTPCPLDIGMVSDNANLVAAQTLYPNENIQGFEVGGSGVVVVVGSNAALDALSFTQQALALIFNSATGTATIDTTHGNTIQFADINDGTASITVNVYVRESGSGTMKAFQSWLQGSEGISGDAKMGSPNIEQGNQAMLSAIQSDPLGIGFVDAGIAAPSGSAVVQIAGVYNADSTTSVGIAPVAIGGSISAITTSIQNALANKGVYPLLTTQPTTAQLDRTFWMMTQGQPTATELSFIQFCQGPDQRFIWEQNGYQALYDFLPK